MTEELKPCPFCGSEEILVHSYEVYPGDGPGFESVLVYTALCVQCKATTNSDGCKDKAIENWNTRTTPIITQEMIERASRAYYEGYWKISADSYPEGSCHQTPKDYEEHIKAALEAATELLERL